MYIECCLNLCFVLFVFWDGSMFDMLHLGLPVVWECPQLPPSFLMRGCLYLFTPPVWGCLNCVPPMWGCLQRFLSPFPPPPGVGMSSTVPSPKCGCASNVAPPPGVGMSPALFSWIHPYCSCGRVCFTWIQISISDPVIGSHQIQSIG